MRKCKFRKGDWVIITKWSPYIGVGVITTIDENESTIPFTTYPYMGGRVAIKEDIAELISFKSYIRLCM